MSKNLLKLYKIPLLLSFALAVVLTAVSVEREFVNIVFIILGCLAGTFFLDLDYLMHTYFVDPKTAGGDLVKDYLKNKDIAGYFVYVQTHKENFKNLTMNSGLFQILLIICIIFAAGSNLILIKALLLASFLNSIYKLTEEYFHNNVKEWFWNLKVDTQPKSMYMYMLVMVFVLLYGIWVF